MAKLIICIGPPGCGKNTWVQNEIKKSKHPSIAACRDDLRQMICGGNIHDYKFSNVSEKLVTKLQDSAIIEALTNGINVYVPDTNYDANTLSHLTQLGKDTKSIVEKHNFFDEFLKEQQQDLPIEVYVEKYRKRCKEWNLKRNKAVPESVIDKFFEKYIVPQNNTIKKYDPQTSKQNAILVDLDGTLYHMTNRSPYEYDKVDTDFIDEVVLKTIQLYKNDGYAIILASGREDSCRELTKKSLNDNNVQYDKLFMRNTGDQRPDWLVKEEIFFKDIAPYYNIKLALDDRNQVVDRYRAMGIKVFQVQPGNF
jgi:predicted kinase